MRYYLGQTEYKWSHAKTQMEYLWVRRELGEDLTRTIEQNGWTWVIHRSASQSLPSDIYCRADIFVESNDDKSDTHFVLKFPQVKMIGSVHD